jgi:hypothetical protein
MVLKGNVGKYFGVFTNRFREYLNNDCDGEVIDTRYGSFIKVNLGNGDIGVYKFNKDLVVGGQPSNLSLVGVYYKVSNSFIFKNDTDTGSTEFPKEFILDRVGVYEGVRKNSINVVNCEFMQIVAVAMTEIVADIINRYKPVAYVPEKHERTCENRFNKGYECECKEVLLSLIVNNLITSKEYTNVLLKNKLKDTELQSVILGDSSTGYGILKRFAEYHAVVSYTCSMINMNYWLGEYSRDKDVPRSVEVLRAIRGAFIMGRKTVSIKLDFGYKELDEIKIKTDIDLHTKIVSGYNNYNFMSDNFQVVNMPTKSEELYDYLPFVRYVRYGKALLFSEKLDISDGDIALNHFYHILRNREEEGVIDFLKSNTLDWSRNTADGRMYLQLVLENIHLCYKDCAEEILEVMRKHCKIKKLTIAEARDSIKEYSMSQSKKEDLCGYLDKLDKSKK